ncbi:MAG: GIY-YIG nuclease family protein [Candidatus Uhrbacteria bacterium]
MWFYVYVLKLYNRNQYYVGYTSDLKRRINEHLLNQVHSTKSMDKKPELIFYEAYRSKIDAMRRERYLKSTKGKRVIRQMLIDTLKE